MKIHVKPLSYKKQIHDRIIHMHTYTQRYTHSAYNNNGWNILSLISYYKNTIFECLQIIVSSLNDPDTWNNCQQFCQI